MGLRLCPKCDNPDLHVSQISFSQMPQSRMVGLDSTLEGCIPGPGPRFLGTIHRFWIVEHGKSMWSGLVYSVSGKRHSVFFIIFIFLSLLFLSPFVITLIILTIFTNLNYAISYHIFPCRMIFKEVFWINITTHFLVITITALTQFNDQSLQQSWNRS